MYETGVSDHHHNKMINSVLRKIFAKGKLKTVSYYCYKNFDQDSFNETLKNRISLPNLSFEKFFEIFQSRQIFLLLINKEKSGLIITLL